MLHTQKNPNPNHWFNSLLLMSSVRDNWLSKAHKVVDISVRNHCLDVSITGSSDSSCILMAAIVLLRVTVTQKVFSVWTVSGRHAPSVLLRKGSTVVPRDGTEGQISVQHFCPIHPQPFISQKTQAGPHLQKTKAKFLKKGCLKSRHGQSISG